MDEESGSEFLDLILPMLKELNVIDTPSDEKIVQFLQPDELEKGIERADSISWNPHKMLGAPLQCSMLLVKKKGLLHKCNSLGADYLFQPDKYYDVSYDTGDMTIQCGRKTDAFKLLLMWLARGEESLSERVDNCMECCQYLRERVRTRPGYIPVSEGEQNKCTNVCFWYVPESMRDQERTEEFWDKIHRVTSIIKKKLVMNGTLMIGYAPLPAKIQRSTSKPEKHSQHNLKHKSSCPKYINTQNYIKSTDIKGIGVNKCFNNNFAANRREIIVQNVLIDTTKNVDIFDTKIPEIRITDSHLTNGKIINDDLDYIKDLNTKTNGKFHENEDELKQTVSHDGLTQTDLTVEENGDQQIHIINVLNIQNNEQTQSENILNLDVQNGFSDVGNSDNKLNRVLQDKAQDTKSSTFNSLNQLNIMNSLPKDNLVSDLTENGVNCTCQESLVTKKVNAFRIVNTCHPPPTYNDMLFILREIERVGHDIVI
ncbi:uncharacterized protein LOC113367867 [Ctenocephalides felis]|uniref:uncharacterized protein LOC113367867 n=1 Tax=Ctenocephalides felis TaxID=7515 RepID=UPI000E6E4162|nr:uncharacterized protein LOC113367867 [Ctenocephalides felis]